MVELFLGVILVIVAIAIERAHGRSGRALSTIGWVAVLILFVVGAFLIVVGAFDVLDVNIRED